MRVRYTGEATIEQIRFGGCDDPRLLLTPGQEYEVRWKEVHSFHTKYHLEQFPDKKFNSVHFEEVGQEEPGQVYRCARFKVAGW